MDENGQNIIQRVGYKILNFGGITTVQASELDTFITVTGIYKLPIIVLLLIDTMEPLLVYWSNELAQKGKPSLNGFIAMLVERADIGDE